MSQDPLDIPFRGIVEQSLAGIYVIQDEVFQYVNATFAGMVGYTPEEMIGMHLRESVPPEYAEEVVGNYHRRASGAQPSIRFMTMGLHKDGHHVPLEVHGSRVSFRDRPAVVGVGINMSEQVRQQEELRASRERLRELAAHINTLREEQRTRIARELHDVVGGMLTSIKLDIQRIERRIPAGEEERQLQAIVTDLLGLTQETIDTVRQISEDLRPGVLDHLGLAAALGSMVREFAERTGIDCAFHSEENESPLSQRRTTGIYRICQEALTNITRHASATRVDISLAREGDRLVVEISDNGRGLPPPNRTGKSIGMLSMAERARELQGCLEIGNHPAGGTRLVLRVPMEEQP